MPAPETLEDSTSSPGETTQRIRTSAPPRSPVRILLVESDGQDARLLSSALARLGYATESVRLLADARTRIAMDSFDLVLSAEWLPDGGGLELLGGPYVPLVLLSKELRADTVRRAFDAGTLDVFARDAHLVPLLDVRLQRIRQQQEERRLLARLHEENESLLRQNRILIELSVKDPLTGILNRRGLDEATRRETARAGRNRQELALAFFDLDHFKSINDRYGHEAGDALLREFSGILSTQGRPVDIIARVGGDEFVALLPSTPLDGALSFAERVRNLVATHTVPFAGAALTTTVSVGAALLSESVEAGRDLLNLADDRLYRAKAAGRNRTVAVDG